MKAKNCLTQALLLTILLSNSGRSEAQTVTAISTAQYDSVFLRSDGSVLACGENQDGQLGDGTLVTTNRPKQVIQGNITAIATSYGASFFLRNDGVMLGTGLNQYGELANGTYANTNVPVPIASNVMAMATGQENTFYVGTDGSLWSAGFNSMGALGNGTSVMANHFQLIEAAGVTAVAGGYQHTVFLKSDGSLWGMGTSGFGQLGLGATDTVGSNRPVRILPGGVTAIATGDYHTMFIKTDGSLWATGYNNYGQLGDSISGAYVFTPEIIVSNNVIAVAAGEYNTFIIKSDGSLWGTGYNIQGELGIGNNSSTNHFHLIVPSNVVEVVSGYQHTLFRESDGSVWAMGDNVFGELGDGFGHGGGNNTGTNLPEEIIFGTNLPAGFGQLISQPLNPGQLLFSYVGMAGTNYALERTFDLTPANWLAQATNRAGTGGAVSFTNTPAANTNNFWRVRALSQ